MNHFSFNICQTFATMVFWNTSRRLLSIYIGFCFNLQNGEIHKNVLPMPCIWIQPLPVTSHWWIKNSGFRERKGVFEPVATFILVLIPWILRKYTKIFIVFFLLFVVYDIISKNLMSLVHWWVISPALFKIQRKVPWFWKSPN